MPIRKSTHSASSRLILNHLQTVTTPQAYIDVAEATGVSYWASRLILKGFVKQGLVEEVRQGSSPRFTLSTAVFTTQTVGAQERSTL
jgi:DNA-binding IclR family transcriptional regulator